MTCPAGHETAANDYCDTCGRPVTRRPTGHVPPAAGGGPPPEAQPCAACDAPLTGRFCERCGRDSLAPAPPRQADAPPGAPGRWWLTAVADREYFDAVQALNGPDAALVTFPVDGQERRFALDGERVAIGRRLPAPGVDLAGPGEDFGVSHQHARLLSRPGGSWAIEDLRSTNGTRVNSHTTVLPPGTRVPLSVGDHVYLGAWTRLTLHRPEPPPW
ncbi:MAG: FHA domain-containing protein [Dactylosporangium sp.]|nr:FHA domain-containing protein [Dactylosporangium sp.]